MRPTHRLFALSVLVALPAVPALAAADPRDLLARSKQAAGGAAWDAATTLRSRGSLSFGGLAGTYEGLEDLRGGRSWVRFDLKVAQGQQGFDGEKPWEVTPNGEVLVKDSPEDLETARTEAYRTARAFWFPDRWPAQVRYDRASALDGRRFDVLRVHPEGGREFELWLDADTALPARTVEPEGGGGETVTTTFLDWREVGGLELPFRTVSVGPHGTSEIVAAEIEIVPAVEANAFQPPAAPADDFTIAAGKTSTTLPFELLNNHIYIEARLNGGEPRRLLVDTGGVNLLTRDAAARLGVEPEGSVQVGGVGDQREEAGFVRLESLTLGDVTFERPLFIVLPFSGIAEASGVASDGLVGFEVFKRFVVTIDYAAGRLTLTRPEAYVASGAPGGAEVPFRFDDRHPIVDGSIDGIPATFTIDTGSRGALALHRPFVEEHGLVERFAAGVETVSGWGVGGPARGRRAGSRVLKLGDVTVAGVWTELSTQEKGAHANRYIGGNVGGGVLKRFTVTFDYGRQVMSLEPNGRSGDAPDRSGIWLNAAGGVLRVEAGAAGSPGAAAGLAVGDRVVAVDGMPVGELRLPDVRARLRGVVGTVVTLTVERAEGAPAEVPLRLGDYR